MSADPPDVLALGATAVLSHMTFALCWSRGLTNKHATVLTLVLALITSAVVLHYGMIDGRGVDDRVAVVQLALFAARLMGKGLRKEDADRDISCLEHNFLFFGLLHFFLRGTPAAYATSLLSASPLAFLLIWELDKWLGSLFDGADPHKTMLFGGTAVIKINAPLVLVMYQQFQAPVSYALAFIPFMLAAHQMLIVYVWLRRQTSPPCPAETPKKDEKEAPPPEEEEEEEAACEEKKEK